MMRLRKLTPITYFEVGRLDAMLKGPRVRPHTHPRLVSKDSAVQLLLIAATHMHQTARYAAVCPLYTKQNEVVLSTFAGDVL